MVSKAHTTKPKQHPFPLWIIPIKPTPNGLGLSKSSQYRRWREVFERWLSRAERKIDL
jgi:hypothetical protein